MKLFDTFEQVEGMTYCKKKPIMVQCKQIEEEFRVNTLEGNYKQGKAGDYLIKGIDGELYICDREIFEKTYDIIHMGIDVASRKSMELQENEYQNTNNNIG